MFSIDHLNTLRAAEIVTIVSRLRSGARVLEVGAGTGQQAQALKSRGYAVEAIEIAASNYAADRRFPVVDYDGRSIPFPDAAFDIVFSSNVLEHVPDLGRMHAEIRRVLRPDGYALHVLPTHAWRLWTTLSAPAASVMNAAAVLSGRSSPGRAGYGRVADVCLSAARRLASGVLQRRHGERGNVVSETWLFHPNWWRWNFAENGFEIVRDEPMGLFYTGNMLLGARWSLAGRTRMARFLGSACHLFEIRAKT